MRKVPLYVSVCLCLPAGHNVCIRSYIRNTHFVVHKIYVVNFIYAWNPFVINGYNY